MTRLQHSVVIHGPQGCGKSMNAQRLARKLGLKTVVDDFDWSQPIPPVGTLLLTCEPPPAGNPHRHVMSFKQAMRTCGFERTPSTTRNPS